MKRGNSLRRKGRVKNRELNLTLNIASKRQILGQSDIPNKSLKKFEYLKRNTVKYQNVVGSVSFSRYVQGWRYH